MVVGDVEAGAQNSDGKSAEAFRTISEVGRVLDVPQHVLRFWESKFSQVKPLKRGGGRRYYRPEDVALLRRIRDLLYTEGYTIRGVHRLFRETGVKAVLEGTGDTALNGPVQAVASEEAVPIDMRSELEAVMAELTAIRRLLGAK